MKKVKRFFNIGRQIPKILVYGEIGKDVKSAEVVAKIQELEQKHKTVNVHINSPGGDIFEGIAIYNALQASTLVVNVYIDGLAASIASIVALSGNKVYMSKHARMMVHKPTSGLFGESEELRSVANQIDELEKTLVGIYAERTGQEVDYITANWMLAGQNTWFDAAKAKESKLVDGVFDNNLKQPTSSSDVNEVWNFYNSSLKQTQNSNPKPNKMDIPKFVALFAKADITFSDNPSESEVYNAMAKVVGLNNQLASENETLKKAQAEALDARIVAMVDAAVTAKKILPKQKETYVSLAKDNFEAVKNLFDDMKPYESIKSKLDKEGSEGENDPYKDLSFKDMQQKYSAVLQSWKKDDPERYKALFKKQYGSEPKS